MKHKPNEKLLSEYIKEMQEAINTNSDKESLHGTLDSLLSELLVELGYKSLIDLYNSVSLWYS